MIAVSRRCLLQLAAASVAATSSRVAAAAPTPSLGAIAARNGYLFGAAAGEVIDKDGPYRVLSAGKTGIIRPAVPWRSGGSRPSRAPNVSKGAAGWLHFGIRKKMASVDNCWTGTN